MTSKNFPSYFYKEAGPLAVPISEELANYEDKILTDEIKRNMDAMVADAEGKDVKVVTIPHSPGEQKRENERYRKLGSTLAPTGSYYSNQDKKIVNVPRTPTLANYLIMAEEMDHQFNRNPYSSIHNRMGVLTDQYEEEKRAKSAALDRVGGHLNPKTKDLARAAMDTYKAGLKQNAITEEQMISEGDAIRNRGPLSDFFLKHFWDSSRKRPHQIAASKFWKDKTRPTHYINERYPELRGPLQTQER